MVENARARSYSNRPGSYIRRTKLAQNTVGRLDRVLRCGRSPRRTVSVDSMASRSRLDHLMGPPLAGGRRALFTHLYPLRTFGLEMRRPTAGDIRRASEVAAVFPAALAPDLEVSLTRIGGLFVPIREQLLQGSPPKEGRPTGLSNPWTEPLDEKRLFEHEVVDAMNLVICELALSGVESEPASVAELGVGSITAERAMIQGAGGPYMERTVGPALALARPSVPMIWPPTPDVVLDRVLGLPRARRLLGMSPALPTFVAAAYSLFARRLYAEALTDAWIAIELMINDLWKGTYRRGSRDTSHRKRLDDGRSFTANLRAELLYATGVFPGDLYDSIQVARKHRNDLMHGGAVRADASLAAFNALRGLLEQVLGEPPYSVAHPQMRWASLF